MACTFLEKTKGVSVEKTEVIPLVNRSIELMMQPLQNSSGFSSNQSMNNHSLKTATLIKICLVEGILSQETRELNYWIY